MHNIKTIKLLILLSTIIAVVPTYVNADQQPNTQLEFSSASSRSGVIPLATRLTTDEVTYDSSKARGSFGIGVATINVTPNTDNRYYDGSGLSFLLGLSRELAITDTIALTARLDFFPTIDFSIIEGIEAYAGILTTAGIVVGKIQQPNQLFFMATVGLGATLQGDDETEESCFICSDKPAGSSAGISGRVSIGLTQTSGQRIELVYIKTGDNGDNRIYTNDEEAYSEAVFLQISTVSD